MLQAFINLGSNVDAENNLSRGRLALNKEFGTLKESHTYRSPDVNGGRDVYLNCAVQLDCELAYDRLKNVLRDIEIACGRDRRRPQSVSLDLDITLLFDRSLRAGKEYIVLPSAQDLAAPHVLMPLADLIPDWTHPLLKMDLISLAHETAPDAITRVT